MSRTLKAKALAELLGKDPAQITRWTQRGLPCSLAGCARYYDPDECRAWITANVREKSNSQSFADPAAAPAMPLTDQEIALVAVLESPGATSIQRADAGFKLAGLAVARDYRKGGVSNQTLESLKKQGEELRRAEAGYLDLARERGELIPRDVAKTVAAGLAQRLIELLATLENALGTQVEIWHADAAFWAQPTELRQRAFRSWVEEQARSLRCTEADAIEALVAETLRDWEATPNG